MTTAYGDAVTAAAQILADARATRDRLTAGQAAAAAQVPGGPPVDMITVLIRAQRAAAARRAARCDRAALATTP